MKIRFPLYARMLTWFFLNLVLLAVIGLVFFQAEFHIRFASLFLGQAEERIQSVAEVINAELNQRPRENWNEVLKLFSDSYHLQFYLFRNDGTQLAGNTVELPKEIRNRVQRPQLGRPLPESQPEARIPQNPPPAQFEPPGNEQGADFRRPRRPERMEDAPHRPGEAPEHRRLGTPPTFFIPTSHPSQYWAGIRMGVGGGTNTVEPAVLLAVSNTLSGGGLFVDYKPWIAVAISAIVISILFWIPLARGLTQSISQLTHVTEEIASGKFTARASIQRRDELGRLAQAVNQMAERLNGFVTGQKRFLGDTAHELCSPIARMQLALGILEQKENTEKQATLEDLREEIQHLSSLVNELLSFSKASLQPASVKLRPIALRSLAEQAIQRETDEGDHVILDIPTELTAMGDPNLLLRSICNLLRNAVRYAGQAGPITISAKADENRVTIKVSDCGPGIPEDSISQIFDPFYRPELSRDRQTGGVGLGLAIVKTCVETCQGKVTCQNLTPKGFEVSLELKAGN